MHDRFLTTLLVTAASVGALARPALAQQGAAHYQLTFQSTWSAATHPSQFPGNPHFSPLVGGTHNGNAVFWQPGGTATAGIEQMAETGATSLLVSEVTQQILAGNGNQVLNYGGSGSLPVSPGQTTVTFTADPNFTQLTLVSMLAPSPDWFVGVHGFELMQNGDWIEDAVIALHVYDAGTDNGTTYTSGNSNTSPQDPIALVTTAAGPFLGASTMVGTFTLQRLSSTLVYGCNNPAGSLSISGSAQLGQTLQFAIADPSGQMPVPSASALAISSSPDANFPCGTLLPGFGLATSTAGEVLLGSIDALALGPPFGGGSAIVFVTLPNIPALVGQQFYFQGLLVANRIGLTQGLSIRVGS